MQFPSFRHALIVFLYPLALTVRAQEAPVQFVFTSDVHYGITRPHFRNADSVDAVIVNRAMIAAINSLPEQRLPRDGGIGAGERVGPIEGLMETGDITNREEKGIQCAANSWQQFTADYFNRLTIRNKDHRQTPLYLSPGNHDVTNAIGYFKPMEPLRDASSMAGIYDSMLHPAALKTKAVYDYSTDKIHYSKDIRGIHFLFVNLWPDSTERLWMEQDLEKVKSGIPVLLFTHSIPDVESRFFTNPNGDHTINEKDRFENLLVEQFKDGPLVTQPSLIEQRNLVAFLKRHPGIKAYFHGHNNYNEFYDWHGPDNDVTLHCFRVDSPMKGRVSAKDEAKLSFQLISIDARTMTMTVRECLWNTTARNSSSLKWGKHVTIPLL